MDTCTVSDYFRRAGRVAEAMHAVPPYLLAVSAITEHEMRHCLALKPQATALRAKVDSFLRVVKVLPFDAEDARASATLRAALETKGLGLGPFDALIAGVAVAKELVLVTSNLREFARLKALKAESWR